MKKRKKIILIVIISVVGLFITCGNIDYSRVKNGKPPILSIYVGKDKYSDVDRWIGFGYMITRCPVESSNALGGASLVSSNNSDDGEYKVSILSMNYVCVSSFDVEIVGYDDYTLVDETKACDTALEEIARDNRFIYYLDCIKSETIFLEYENGDKITLKTALNSGKASISDLMDKGLEVYQKRITD